TYTAVVPSGNDIRVRYVDPQTADAALSVSLSDQDITVNLATDASGIITSTADDIQLAVSSSPNASALVVASVTGTGSDIQTAADYQSLSGGMDFNDNGHWDVYGMAIDAAVLDGENIRIKKMGKIACQFDVAPTASQIGKSVYLSVNLGKASIGIAPTAAFSAIVHLGRLVSATEVDFRGAVLRGVHS
ncbi:MAG: major tail sheath protein, partial [Actinomycetota bacterium]